MPEKPDQIIRLNIGFTPEAAVSEPLLLQTDCDAFLTFSAVVKNEKGLFEDAGIGVVEFHRCNLTKFGYPNDEALRGHPLYQNGLDVGSRVFEVLYSSWIREITEQNRLCFPNTEDSDQRHFIFTFHDSTFECIADGFQTSLHLESYEKVLTGIAQRILT